MIDARFVVMPAARAAASSLRPTLRRRRRSADAGGKRRRFRKGRISIPGTVQRSVSGVEGHQKENEKGLWCPPVPLPGTADEPPKSLDPVSRDLAWLGLPALEPPKVSHDALVGLL